ncbi:alkaline phosphatase family protein [bacterium]|nr:alkaline phosphatase family protein [candidate division CSSED10-310 bacterium]
MTRMAVIGIDGGTFKVINRLRRKGRLPVLNNLMERGAHGILYSTDPPLSAVAWPTITTGADPGRHGVFAFHQRRPDSYHYGLITSRSIRAPRLWNIVNQHGLRTGLVNIPVTYPPEKVDGYMITGMLTPSSSVIFTHPPGLHGELLAGTGCFPLERGFLSRYRAGGRAEALAGLFDLTRAQTDTMLYLLKKHPCEFFMGVYRATDLVQHVIGKFWRKRARERHRTEYRKFGRMIDLMYEEIDLQMGRLLAVLPSDCTVMVISDHGAGPMRGQFYVNRWLMEHGWLRLVSAVDGITGAAAEWRRPDEVLRRLRELGKVKLPEMAARRFEATAGWEERLVDWRRTVAYASWRGNQVVAVRINLTGREPCGIVAPGAAAEALLDLMAQALGDIRLPDGRPLFTSILRGSELYRGDLVESGPDLVAIPRGYSFNCVGRLDGSPSLTFSSGLNAQHRRDGILIAAGPGIRRGAKPSGAKVTDVAPTALRCLGIPTPATMDGHVLDALLEVSELPVITETHDAPAAGPATMRPTDQEVYSEAEQKELEEHLRDLGYLD